MVLIPLIAEVDRPTTFGLDYEDITLTTSDRVKIKAYLITHPPPEFDLKCSLDLTVRHLLLAPNP